MLGLLVFLAMAVGFFIGSTTTVSIAFFLETLAHRRAENKKIEPLVEDYVTRFGGTTEEAREIILENLRK